MSGLQQSVRYRKRGWVVRGLLSLRWGKEKKADHPRDTMTSLAGSIYRATCPISQELRDRSERMETFSLAIHAVGLLPGNLTSPLKLDRPFGSSCVHSAVRLSRGRSGERNILALGASVFPPPKAPNGASPSTRVHRNATYTHFILRNAHFVPRMAPNGTLRRMIVSAFADECVADREERRRMRQRGAG